MPIIKEKKIYTQYLLHNSIRKSFFLLCYAKTLCSGFGERDDDDSTTGSREPGERAGATEGRARGDLSCGRSLVRRGEDRGGVGVVDLSRRDERYFARALGKRSNEVVN
jgi:hypothetical protein